VTAFLPGGGFLARLVTRVSAGRSEFMPRPAKAGEVRPYASATESVELLDHATDDAGTAAPAAVTRRRHDPSLVSGRTDLIREGTRAMRDREAAVPAVFAEAGLPSINVLDRLLPLESAPVKVPRRRARTDGEDRERGQREDEAPGTATRAQEAPVPRDGPNVLRVRPPEQRARPAVSTKDTSTESEPAQPAVVVHIGRIDVRAVHAAAPPAPPVQRPRPRAPSLDVYLQMRERGRT